jgi:hypothetical protein
MDLPEGWKATTVKNVFVLHDPNRWRPSDENETPEEGVYVMQLKARRETLDEYAEHEMRRAVPQGDLERSAETLGDLGATMYEWTDGVAKNITWFVAPSEDVWYRIDYGTRDVSATANDVRARADKLMSRVNWSDVEAGMTT